MRGCLSFLPSQAGAETCAFLQAVSSLLHGLDKVQLTKQCVKADGEIVAINTQMQVLPTHAVHISGLCIPRRVQAQTEERLLEAERPCALLCACHPSSAQNLTILRACSTTLPATPHPHLSLRDVSLLRCLAGLWNERAPDPLAPSRTHHRAALPCIPPPDGAAWRWCAVPLEEQPGDALPMVLPPPRTPPQSVSCQHPLTPHNPFPANIRSPPHNPFHLQHKVAVSVQRPCAGHSTCD